MARRNPARFLAPIALLAFVFALYTIIDEGRQPAGSDTGTPASASPTATPKKSTKKKSSKKSSKPKTYTVKSGDTPLGIAESTGVSLDTLMELNPDLDPQTLTPGQRLRLSE